MIIIDSELREQISRVLNSDASLVDLYQWLMARNWNIHKHENSPVALFALDVEDVLLAWSDGLQSKSQAIRSLGALVAIQAQHDMWISSNVPVIVSVQFGAEPPRIVKSTSAQTRRLFQPALAEL